MSRSSSSSADKAEAHLKLREFPPETLSLIVGFLDGVTLNKLYFTGNKLLRAKLLNERCVMRLYMPREWLCDGSFRIYRRLPHLRVLDIDGEHFQPLRQLGSPMTPNLPHLVELRLPFARSIQIFFTDLFPPRHHVTATKTEFDVAAAFPKLELLELDSYGSHSAVEVLIPVLPNSLRLLTIHGRSFDEICLTSLPTSLESLTLNHRVLAPVPGSVNWPEHLHTLHLPSSLWERLPNNFPSSITSLSLNSLGINNHTARVDAPLAAHLIHANLNSSPDPLAVLRLFEDSDLKSLEMTSAPYTNDPLITSELQFPAKLTSLRIALNDGPRLYRYLPKTLTDLYIVTSTKWPLYMCIKSLPRNLKNFVVQAPTQCSVPVAHLEFLPDTLEVCPMVESEKLDGMHFKDLPRALKSLSIGNTSRRITMTAQYIGDLPRTLTSLTIDSDAIGLSNLALKALPQTLLHFRHFRRLEFDGSGIAFLPPNLRTLILPLSVGFGDFMIAKLPRRLEVLQLWGCSDSLSGASFRHLPPGLQKLTISKMASISDASLADLPDSLTDISLPGGSSLTDRLFFYLPRLTRYLTLKGNTTLTPKCVEYTRPTLVQLDIRDNSNFKHLRRLTFNTLKVLAKKASKQKKK